MYTLLKDNSRIDIIVAASNISAIFPIVFFHSTEVMNILTPTTFVSLYGGLTSLKKGIISPVSMKRADDLDNWGNRPLRRRAAQAIAKYVTRGF